MDWARNCAVVIPCLNEAAAIGQIVSTVRRQLPNVIVVDDHSTDSTANQAVLSGAQVLQHSVNLGKGAALRTGWTHAREQGFSWVLFMDGDGQHAPEDISALLATAEKTGVALVVGNRMGNLKRMPRVRRWVNRFMSRSLSRLTGVRLPDSQCGFRLVNLAALSQTGLVTHHFEIESEMLVNFIAAGRKVAFVPVQTIYKSNPSKIHPLVDTWRWLRWSFKLRNAANPALIIQPCPPLDSPA